MKCYVLIIFLYALLRSSLVSALSIEVVEPAGGLIQFGRPTAVRWAHEPNDPSDFDFRFVIDEVDVGLARANIVVGDQQNPTGEVEVRFPRVGFYTIKAVSGPEFTVIGTSNQVEVVAFRPTNTITVTQSSSRESSTAPPSSTSTPSSMPMQEPTWSRNARAGIIAGIVLGVIVLVFLTVFIVFMMRRNRARKAAERLSFHPEQMIQRRRSRFLSLVPKRLTILRSPRNTDPEQAATATEPPSRTASTGPTSPRSPTSPKTARFAATNPFVTIADNYNRSRPLPTPPASAFVPTRAPPVDTPTSSTFHSGIRPLPVLPPIPTFHISPASPRPQPVPPQTAPAGGQFLPPLRRLSESPPLSAHFERHRALPTVPRTQRQQQMETRLTEVREQIRILEQDSNDVERVLANLKRQLQWLMDNIDSDWALGLTDTTPPGFSRFMTP